MWLLSSLGGLALLVVSLWQSPSIDFLRHASRSSPIVFAWERTVAQEKPLQVQLSVVDHRWRVARTSLGSTTAFAERSRTGLTLYVPVDTPLVLALKSEDYIYTLGIPEMDLKEMAIPGLEFKLAFCPKQVGEYLLEGEEMCGEPGMIGPGRIVVESREAFMKRLRGHSP